MENFFAAAAVVIAIPYGLMFLVLIWNVIGPALSKHRGRGANEKHPASHE